MYIMLSSDSDTHIKNVCRKSEVYNIRPKQTIKRAEKQRKNKKNRDVKLNKIV